jgi:hypothetical protein
MIIPPRLLFLAVTGRDGRPMDFTSRDALPILDLRKREET